MINKSTLLVGVGNYETIADSRRGFLNLFNLHEMREHAFITR